MTEFFYNKTEFASAETIIIKDEMNLKWLGNVTDFKPGMPINLQIAVSLPKQWRINHTIVKSIFRLLPILCCHLIRNVLVVLHGL